MKNIKRLLCILLVAVLVAGIVPFVDYSQYSVDAAPSVADDFVSIAESYVGLNFEKLKAEMRSKDFDLFWDDYNNHWCAWFVSNCAREAGISKTAIPNATWASFGDWYMAANSYFYKNKSIQPSKARGGKYIPKRGDLIFYAAKGSSEIDHVGIVSACNGKTVRTVEGNTYGWDWTKTIVGVHEYSLDRSNIYGYAEVKTSYDGKGKSLSTTMNGYNLQYASNGGTGTMAATYISMPLGLDKTIKLKNNAFTKPGYKFDGWNLQRKSDGAWCYTNGLSYTWDTQKPGGYTLASLTNGQRVNLNKFGINGETVVLKAKWILNDHIHRWDAGTIIYNPTVDSLGLKLYRCTCGEVKYESIPRLDKKWKRLYGQNAYNTMKAIVQKGFTKTGGTVVIASGENFVDALSASGFAGLTTAPIILTPKSYLHQDAKELLAKLKPKTIYIMGGPKAIEQNVALQIEWATGVKPIRLYGQDGAATSAAIAMAGKGLWSTEGVAIITTDKAFQDGLAISPIAYSKKYPVLMASGGTTLKASVQNALRDLGIKSVIIVGGPLAVNSNVEAQLRNMGITVKTRLYGKTAIETSAEIAKWGLSNGLKANNMAIATSRSFQDALAGGAFCGKNNAVLVLADDKHSKNWNFAEPYKNGINTAYVFGGPMAVGNNTWKALCTSTM